jgi:hypothetical protein
VYICQLTLKYKNAIFDISCRRKTDNGRRKERRKERRKGRKLIVWNPRVWIRKVYKGYRIGKKIRKPTP